ncbi:MAG TPA: dihydrolipoamide acetyltransferase family protein [Thermoanaerobaculia bacterium]|nr:dihydrolipoamide acetyltransferase family protein [Thermoanaerobaculia bacterium]
MATRIVMPSFGMYTAEGTFARWLVAAGAAVEAGDLVAEITTEKASYEIEAPASGRLHPLAKVGDALTVEGLIGWVLGEGEEPPVEERDDEPVPVPGLPSPAATPTAEYARVKASPAARRLAAERGVDLAALAGSGPGGRVVEADVLAAAPRAAAAAERPAPPALPWRVRERIPLTGARGAVARRLRQVMDTAVPLTLTREVRADALVAARSRLVAQQGPVSWDAVFVKLLADALRARPALNAVIAGEEIAVLDEVHVGFALPLAGGLVVPVVRDADARPLAEVATAVRQLGERARAGRLAPPDLLGGTATVSNLGAHGVDAFTPVLNPPQSVILGVGRLAARPVVEEGRLVAAITCVLSLTFDHRVADGVPAAELLAAIAAGVEDTGWVEREVVKVAER